MYAKEKKGFDIGRFKSIGEAVKYFNKEMLRKFDIRPKDEKRIIEDSEYAFNKRIGKSEAIPLFKIITTLNDREGLDLTKEFYVISSLRRMEHINDHPNHGKQEEENYGGIMTNWVDGKLTTKYPIEWSERDSKGRRVPIKYETADMTMLNDVVATNNFNAFVSINKEIMSSGSSIRSFVMQPILEEKEESKKTKENKEN